MRILVVGVGGIGGIVAASLHVHDPALVAEVVAITTNEQIAAAITRDGFRLRGEGGERVIPGEACTQLDPETAPFDFVLLATQPPQVEAAARSALPFLAEQGAMVCFQNGLCEDRIAAIAGPDRVFGGIVAWGGSMPEPGLYDRTSAGGFVIGRMDGSPDPRLERLAWVLEAVGPVTISSNLQGARWSKLALNCAISALGTIGGDRLGVLMRSRVVRRLALELMTEVAMIASAEGVALEKVAGTLDLDWLALTPSERGTRVGSASLVAKHSLLLAVGTRYRRMRSSMLNAIERGRPPAVEFLNGEVADRGERLGIPTPTNQAARELVWTISRGERKTGMTAIADLAAVAGLRG